MPRTTDSPVSGARLLRNLQSGRLRDQKQTASHFSEGMMDDTELREIADGFNEEFMRAMQALIRHDGLLALTPVICVAHTAGGRAANSPDIDQTDGLQPVTATLQLPSDSLESGDAAQLIDAHVNAARVMKGEITRRTFAQIEESAQQHNMVVDARGRALSVDLIVEMLEKMEFDFDASGNAILPTLFLNPTDMQKVSAELETDDAKKKFSALIAKKKEAKGL